LRARDSRHDRQRGSARRQMQKISAGKFHFEPPFTSFAVLRKSFPDTHLAIPCPGVQGISACKLVSATC
jgi:hypothetical protein